MDSLTRPTLIEARSFSSNTLGLIETFVLVAVSVHAWKSSASQYVVPNQHLWAV